MKKKFSRILGVSVTLVLLVSLGLFAAPVAALSTPSVTVDPTTISAEDAEYNIRFVLDEQLTGGTTVDAAPGTYDLAEIGDSFVITATAASTGVTIVEDAYTAVTVALSGLATLDSYVGGPTGGTHTIDFTGAGTATVTILTVDPADGSCTGSWDDGSGTPTAAVTVGDDVADTITVVFPVGTIVEDDPDVTVTMVAGPGWINGVWTNASVDTSIDEAGTADTRTVVITLDHTNKDRIGEGAQVRLTFTEGITNPDDADDYNLTVETSQEDAVTSADYEITVPDVGVLPGIVQQLNAVGTLMAQDTGDDAINKMVDTAGEDYTIVVGPGEYEIDATIELDQAGLTLESSAGAEDTILVVDTGLNADVILITVADVTVDGFTIEDTEEPYTAILVTTGGDDVTVINNIMTDTTETGYPEGISIEGSATGATVSGNELDLYHTMMVQVAASGCTLSDNTFGAGVNLHNTVSDITITGNTLIGVELWGIVLWDGGTYTDVLIEGNTISETTEDPAIGILLNGTAEIDNLQILGNDITDNEGVGIVIDSGVTTPDSAIAIKFNTITGNDADNDGYGIQNDATAATVVDATLNWWGTAVSDDVAAMVNDTVTAGSVTTYEPFLADTADAVFSASDVAVGEDSLDAKDDVGVKVSEADDATVIVVTKYTANPQEAIADAIAFYDVYVAGATVDVTLKFYAGDKNSELHVWSADTEDWADLSEDESFGFSVYGGYLYVVYDAELLAGTPFAVVAGPPAEAGTVTLTAPAAGATGLPITNVPFTWEAVDDAEYYMVVVSANADFTILVASDEAAGTAYTYSGTLDYSTPYYYQITAMKGISEVVARSDVGAFLTMAEPVEPTAPVVVQQAPPVEMPDIVIPAAEMVTPGWLYAVIAIAAVLVIAVIVLIVRTRRAS